MRKMTNAALMEMPLIRIKDIQQAFGVSYDAAARFIRTVKAHSDVATTSIQRAAALKRANGGGDKE